MTITERHNLAQQTYKLRTNERPRDRAQMTIDTVFSPVKQTRLSKYGI